MDFILQYTQRKKTFILWVPFILWKIALKKSRLRRKNHLKLDFSRLRREKTRKTPEMFRVCGANIKYQDFFASEAQKINSFFRYATTII